MFLKSGDGVWADANDKEHNLRLFSSVTELGWVGAVFDLKGKVWVAREWADDIESGKFRAQEIAKAVLKNTPELRWKPNGQK
jgi:hypothetical protein